MIVCGIMIWTLGFLFLFRFSLQALGDTVIPMFSGLLELAVRPVVVFCLPASLGFYRMSIAETATWLLTAIMLGVGYFIRLKKIEQNPELVIRRKKT